mgnify:CR=1 FL=1
MSYFQKQDISSIQGAAARLLAAAVIIMCPGVFPIEGREETIGFSYDFVFTKPFSKELFPFLEETVKGFIAKNIPIKTLEMVPKNACDFFRHKKRYYPSFFAKHSKDGIGLEAKIIGRYLEIEKSYNAPELDYSSETIKLEMVDSRAPAWSAKTEFLKKYHYDEKYFKLKVAREGDYTIDGAMGGRPIISTKLFDLDKKDDAYQYMTDLFKKEFLGL